MISKIKAVFKDAHLKVNEADQAKELKRLGELRAGSVGALMPDGSAYYSQCGRLAQARLLGEQQPPTAQMRAMFNGGFALEGFIESNLVAAGLEFTKEQPCSAEIAPGVVVHGRPDFDVKLGDEWVGVEVKSLASPTSVIKQVKNDFPFVKHLLQSAIYCILLKRTRWLIVIGNAFYVNERGYRIEPGIRWYELRLDGGDKFIVENEKGVTIELPFKPQHLVDYYAEVLKSTEERRLMPRPTEGELKVDTYNRCNYCHMQNSCNQADNGQIDFEGWVGAVNPNKSSKP